MPFDLENEIKKKSAAGIEDFRAGCKKHRKRKRICKGIALFFLAAAFVAAIGFGYYAVDSKIPSTLRIRAGVSQSFRLGVPAKGEIISVGKGYGSNIPREALHIDLSDDVIMKMDSDCDCSVEVKLFGFLPIKRVGIKTIGNVELIPVGKPIGMYLETKGVLVVGMGEFTNRDQKKVSPCRNIVKSGDYIRKVDGRIVQSKEEFNEMVANCNGNSMILTLERGKEVLDVHVLPEEDTEGKYLLGLWVRDNAQGIGTITYMDEDGNFGALGHGIADLDTNVILEVGSGKIYDTDIVSIRKGIAGEPGELSGLIVYSDEHIVGEITENGTCGIRGTCQGELLRDNLEGEALPIALKQEIKKGPAKILCTVSGETKYYDVEITAIHLEYDKVNRGLEIKVTDPGLLALTGGIIQGMSGSPILQDGYFVGAVTHVLVNDPTRGYGIFIENMLD